MSLPVALDTNVLVRLLVNDEPCQALRAAELIDYKLPREAVITAFEGLLAINHVHLEQEDHIRQALAWHRQGLDFADALHLARSEGCGALISFDRQLAQIATQLNLQPIVQSP
jgi:predicted nucleic-acid-binding protein